MDRRVDTPIPTALPRNSTTTSATNMSDLHDEAAQLRAQIEAMKAAIAAAAVGPTSGSSSPSSSRSSSTSSLAPASGTAMYAVDGLTSSDLSLDSMRVLKQAQETAEENKRLNEEMAQMRRMMEALLAKNAVPPPASSSSERSLPPIASGPISPSLSVHSSISRGTSSRSARREKEELEAQIATLKNAIAAAKAPKKYEHHADVVFLVDCTGSMGKWIEATKAKMQEILNEVKRQYPNVLTRVGFVGYRDFDGISTASRDDQFEGLIKPLTEEIEHLRDFIGGVKATGGGDAAEDVFGGLERCLALGWQGEARVIIHFADAPGHGKHWNGGCGDNHANFDADGSLGKQLVDKLIKQRINYYFGQITSHTKSMTDRLEEHYKRDEFRQSTMEVLEMGAEPTKFLEKCVYAITSSISSSIPSGRRI